MRPHTKSKPCVKAFEEWATLGSDKMDITKDFAGHYRNSSTHDAYCGWIGCWAYFEESLINATERLQQSKKDELVNFGLYREIAIERIDELLKGNGYEN